MWPKRVVIGALGCLLLLAACDKPRPPAPNRATASPVPAELEQNTPPTPADEPFAGVFSPLDGHWRGQFKIYTHSQGQLAGPRPRELNPAYFGSTPYKLSQTIEVEQTYRSESPYFQRVDIKDTYRDASGAEKTAESHGVNKVQDGVLWCLVKKPDETVIHRGTTEGKDTIIWQRDLPSPLKVEYFRETVTPTTYLIVGYGYYGTDDPQKAPRTFFLGEYKRVP